jgi:ribosome-associated toxin RatA of RatAB toxin-antitoxin module
MRGRSCRKQSSVRLPGLALSTNQYDSALPFKRCRYTQNQLYSLVSDIPSYSTFIPFCTTSQILSSNSSPSDPSYQSSNASFQPSEESQQQDLKAMVQAGLEFDVKAELEVGFGAFVEKFVSRVEGRPGEMVKVSLIPQPEVCLSVCVGAEIDKIDRQRSMIRPCFTISRRHVSGRCRLVEFGYSPRRLWHAL